ncbi:hypothetical protein HMPREF0322_01059 [Desulfitobacterium hafniense DP7]|uniref:Uncharacterized protein n=1 Tax=Desulfitobacterium hafniense DP7 TaxID=537010 RepID=G9XJC7_DESHA|nr:hypothetical protein HMPREF0322_01059 [Desulfitobacterium hafniense DP7]
MPHHTKTILHIIPRKSPFYNEPSLSSSFPFRDSSIAGFSI